MITMTRPFLFIILFVYTFLCYSDAYAISISPKRVIFDKNTATAEIIITNDDDEEQNYMASFQHYTMNEDSGYLEIAPKNTKIKNVIWADEMIKIEPNIFTIPAKSTKKITLSLINSDQKNSGEYRSHLWVRTLKKQALPPENNQMKIPAMAGVSIPIFIRYGHMDASAIIDGFNIEKINDNQEYKATFTINRFGNRSLYGSIEIACKNNEEEIILTQIYGIAVYTEVKKKALSFNFDIPKNIKTNCKSIKLSYNSSVEDKNFMGSTMAYSEKNNNESYYIINDKKN